MRGAPRARQAWELAVRAVRCVASASIDLLLPSTCAACGADMGLRGPACPACTQGLALSAHDRRCIECSAPLRPDDAGEGRCGGCHAPRAFRVEAPRPHAGVARELVHALKYARRRDAGDELGRVTSADERVRAALRRAEVIVPVPADPVRKLERGFNAARVVAEALVEGAGCRARVRDVLVLRRAPAQVGRSAAGRRVAPRGTMRGGILAALCLRGRRVLLVDDVVTTGATLAEAARVARRLGAASVEAVACTRADGQLSGGAPRRRRFHRNGA